MQPEDKPAEGIALQWQGLVKEYPGVRALDGVSLALRYGQIHALVGANGSGKTTLMRMLVGLERPDAGEIRKDGQRLILSGTAEALTLGIGLVPQKEALAGSLTALENIMLGAEAVRHGMLLSKMPRKRAQALAEIYGLQVDWNARSSHLSEGARRRVALLKLLYRDCRVLLLDEPLSGLDPREAGTMLKALRSLAEEGRSILISSRTSAELQGNADQSAYLDKGRTVEASETERPMWQPPEARPLESGAALLMVQNLAVAAVGREDHRVCNVSLTVHRGEIVCLAGDAGDGQNELALAVAGRLRPDSGRVLLGTYDITDATIRSRSALGLGFLPSARRQGWIEGASLADNLALDRYFQPLFARGGFLRRAALKAHARTLTSRLNLPLEADLALRADNFSEAECRNALLSRAMDTGPTLLVTVEPGQGLDLGSADALYARLRAWRDRGHAVLLASTDVAEMLGLSDRIVLLREGVVVAELDARYTTAEELALYRSGTGKERLF